MNGKVFRSFEEAYGYLDFQQMESNMLVSPPDVDEQTNEEVEGVDSFS